MINIYHHLKTFNEKLTVPLKGNDGDVRSVRLVGIFRGGIFQAAILTIHKVPACILPKTATPQMKKNVKKITLEN